MNLQRIAFRHCTSVATALVLSMALTGCMNGSSEPSSESVETQGGLAFFMPDALAKDVVTVACTLSDGTPTFCYEVTVVATPANVT